MILHHKIQLLAKTLKLSGQRDVFFPQMFLPDNWWLGDGDSFKAEKEEAEEKKITKNNMISAPATLNSVQNKLFHSKRHLPYSGTIYQYK